MSDAGYRSLEVLHRRGDLSVARGLLPDGRPVVVKRVNHGGRHGLEAAVLRFEYAMLQRVAGCRDIVQPVGWHESESELAMLLEDIGGQSLQQLTANRSLPVTSLVQVGQAVARALRRVHAAGMVHKDVNPGNIVHNPATGATQLIDFGAVAPLPREVPEVENVHAVGGGLPFMAPEQTGVGQRNIDARCDLYALGVTLFKLCAGMFPHPQQDITSFIAALLTQEAPNPRWHVPETPPCVAAVVCKLLNKNPDNRYQSAAGLEADLQRCATLLAAGQVNEFELGEDDRSSQLFVPQQLFGREVALSQFKSAATRARSGAAVAVVIHGAAGVGKTALMVEERRWAVLEGGLCLYGAYDRLHTQVPLWGISQCLAQLVRFISQEPDDVAQRWTERLRQAAGDLGLALVQVAPTLKPLLGHLPPLADVPPAHAARRLMACLQRLFWAAAEMQPLTLLFDDVHWADSATKRLLPMLLQDARPGRGLAVVCAGEPERGMDWLTEALRTVRPAPTTLELKPLDAHSIGAMVAAALGCADAPLSAALLQQSGGNPLLVHRSLAFWAHTGRLHRDATGAWRCLPPAGDGPQGMAMLADHLQELPGPTRHVLGVAACVGQEFRLSVLMAAAQRDRGTILEALQPALEQGVVLPLGPLYRLAAYMDGEVEVVYRFAHRQLVRAALSGLAAELRHGMHQRIGQALLRFSNPAHATLQDAVGVAHLALAASMYDTQRAREHLAHLHVSVAAMTKRMGCLSESADLLRMAEHLMMQADRGPADRDLQRDIAVALAEAEYLTGAPGAAAGRLRQVLAYTPDPVQRSQVYRQESAMHGQMRQVEACISAGLAGLSTLGVRVRRLPRGVEYWLNLRARRWAPRASDVAALLRLNRVAQSRGQALGAVCEVFCPVCYDQPAFYVRLLRMRLRAILRHGTAAALAGAYAGLTMFLARQGRYREARAVSEAGLNLPGLVERHPLAHLQCLAAHQGSVEWLASPTVDMLRNYRKAFTRCLEVGDAVLPGHFAVQDYMIAGMFSQERVLAREARYAELCGDGIDNAQAFGLRAYTAVYRCLRGEGSADVLVELQHQAERRGGFAACNFYMATTLLYALHGPPTEAVRSALAAWRHGLRHYLSLHTQAFFYVFAGIAAIDHCRIFKHRMGAAARLVRRCQRALQQVASADGSLWAGAHLLLRAHQEALAGRHGEAARLYEQAGDVLPHVGSPMLVGLGWECTARFYAHQGLRTAAQLYLCKARRAYAGVAPAKVRRIEEEFPGLLSESPEKVDIDTGVPTFQPLYTYQRRPQGPLGPGLEHVHELTETLRMQPTLEALEECVCELLLRHGGATRVVMTRAFGGGVMPVVQKSVSDDVTDEPIAVPMTVLNYAVRSDDSVVINDAVVNEAFSRDAYLLQARPRSLACMPVHDGTRVCAVAYLENALLTQAFGADTMQFVCFILAEAGPRITELQDRAAYDHRVNEFATGLARETWQALDALQALPRQGATLRDVERPLQRILQITEQLGAAPSGRSGNGELPGQNVGGALQRRE